MRVVARNLRPTVRLVFLCIFVETTTQKCQQPQPALMIDGRTNLVDENRLPKFFGELGNRTGILGFVDEPNEPVFPLYLLSSFKNTL